MPETFSLVKFWVVLIATLLLVIFLILNELGEL